MLGRPYTIYNTVLNSNVPAILREQGAIGIPVDCYPVEREVPVFTEMYWGHGQRILRAAHQVRRSPGVYGLYCSNYSCGPDSFNLHFFAHIMEGKPFAIIETDGHSGDAGTKTRVEAFLHCVAQDLAAAQPGPEPHDFRKAGSARLCLSKADSSREILLIPWIGPGSETVAAAFRGVGIRTECLPMPDAEALHLGRRFTSGKECLPMCLTLGNLIKRVQRPLSREERLAVLMPGSNGPCREGAYNLLNRITLDRLGWSDHVRIWSLDDSGYFDTIPTGLSMLFFTGVTASDLLLDALHHVRPVEARQGAAQEIYRRHFTRLVGHIEKAAAGDLSTPQALWQAATGRFFGIRRLLQEAAADFAAIRTEKVVPTVALVGEIYVRLDPFANDFLVEKLEARGLRVKLAPFTEWLEYLRSHHQGRRKVSEPFRPSEQPRSETDPERGLAGGGEALGLAGAQRGAASAEAGGGVSAQRAAGRGGAHPGNSVARVAGGSDCRGGQCGPARMHAQQDCRGPVLPHLRARGPAGADAFGQWGSDRCGGVGQLRIRNPLPARTKPAGRPRQGCRAWSRSDPVFLRRPARRARQLPDLPALRRFQARRFPAAGLRRSAF